MADENELKWSVSDPGMDLLERAGLAGLYMALRAADEAHKDLSPLSWTEGDLKPDSVTVHWIGPPQPAFQMLMEWAWQVHNGVLYLPAIHGERERAGFEHRVTQHNGIMRTFLQHTNVQPKGEPVYKVLQLGEDKEVSVSFQPPIIRPPKIKDGDLPVKASGPKKLLKAWKDVDELFDRKQKFRTEKVSLSNWVHPGIAPRYGGERAWEGNAERAV